METDSWVTVLTVTNFVILIVFLILVTVAIIKVNRFSTQLDTETANIKATLGRLVRELNEIFTSKNKVDKEQSDTIRFMSGKHL